jgi:hypothetical protein
VVCLWVGVGTRAALVQPDPELSPPLAAAVGRHSPGTVTATATGIDGLWLRAGLCPGGGECSGTLWFCAGQHRGPYGHVGPCAKGTCEPAGRICAAVSGTARRGGPTRHCRDGRHDDLHDSAEPTEGQTPAPVAGDAVGGGLSQAQCDDRLRDHLRERGRNRAALGALYAGGRVGIEQSTACGGRWG